MEKTVFDLPETTRLEIIEKIEALVCEIRGDWTDPRCECIKIVQLCEKLKQLENGN